MPVVRILLLALPVLQEDPAVAVAVVLAEHLAPVEQETLLQQHPVKVMQAVKGR